MSEKWLIEPAFDKDCSQCYRLVDYLKQIKTQAGQNSYHCAPVPSFGSNKPQLLIVGLAPGKDGANRTGRPFTGDYAGEVLYQALHQHGFANRPVSQSKNDTLSLKNCRITNAVKCVPPKNQPTGEEIRTCSQFLKAEIDLLPTRAVILALGLIAHGSLVRVLNLKLSQYPFKHGKVWGLPNKMQLLDSYHCSRYNINTKRLSKRQFSNIIAKADKLVNHNLRNK